MKRLWLVNRNAIKTEFCYSTAAQSWWQNRFYLSPGERRQICLHTKVSFQDSRVLAHIFFFDPDRYKRGVNQWVRVPMEWIEHEDDADQHLPVSSHLPG
jgi:hypothetical protein